MAFDTAATVYDEPVEIPVVETARAARPIDRKLVHGIAWTGGVKGVLVAVTWASTVIVARLLSREDYGLLTMASVYIGLTALIIESGLGSAMVALRDFDDDTAAQLHSVSTLFGFVAFATACVLAVPLSKFFGTRALIPVLIVLGAALVLDSLRTVPMAILARQLQFKQIALLEAVKGIVAVVLTVTLAAAGAAHWALVLGNVAGTIVLTLVVLIRLPHRMAAPRFAELRSTLRFTTEVLTGQLTWYGYSNADFVVAGRVLGPFALGEYSMAWTLIAAPADKIMSIFGRVMPMMLAAVQRDIAEVRRYFVLFTETLAMVMVPICTGIALVSPELVPLLFGQKWIAIVAPLQCLCFYMMVHISSAPTSRVLQVTGQQGYPARWGIATLLVLPPAFYFGGQHWGTIGIAAVWVTLYPLLLVPVYVKVCRTLEMPVRDYIACIAPTVLDALIMSVVVLSIRISMPPAWPLAFRLAIETTAGAATFAIAAFFTQRRRLSTMFNFLRSLRSSPCR